jgi:hypothetical protein
MDGSADKVEIIEMISRYSHGADGTVAEAYAGVFTEDGTLVARAGQPDERVLKGHGPIKVFHNAAVAGRRGVRTRHQQSTTIFLELEQNRAVTRTYLMTTSIHEARPPSTDLTSVYEDEFIRTSAGWRIQKRQIIPDVKGTLDAIRGK